MLKTDSEIAADAAHADRLARAFVPAASVEPKSQKQTQDSLSSANQRPAPAYLWVREDAPPKEQVSESDDALADRLAGAFIPAGQDKRTDADLHTDSIRPLMARDVMADVQLLPGDKLVRRLEDGSLLVTDADGNAKVRGRV